MRLSPDTGKEDCHVIDFVDSTSKLPGVVSVPTLFGLDPSTSIDGALYRPSYCISHRSSYIYVLHEEQSPEELKVRAETEQLEHPEDTSETPSAGEIDIQSPKTVTFVDYDNPFELAEDASGIPPTRQLSRNAWVRCGSDTYVLECLGKGFVRIEKVKAGGEYSGFRWSSDWLSLIHSLNPGKLLFAARFVQVAPDWGSKRPFDKLLHRRPRQFLTVDTLELAIRGSDTFVAHNILKGHLSYAYVARFHQSCSAAHHP